MSKEITTYQNYSLAMATFNPNANAYAKLYIHNARNYSGLQSTWK